MNNIMKVSVIGLGYIGLPTCALIASNMIQVYGMDVDINKVNAINSGDIHVLEPDLLECVISTVKSGYLSAHCQVQPSDVYLIVVPTPFKDNFVPDISYVENATDSVIPLLKEGDLCIIESTSPIGTTELMAERIFTLRPELRDNMYIAYCPERVLPGQILKELVSNDRVIGGINVESTEAAVRFYAMFVKGNLHRTNSRTAEMCKLTENASRDNQIAFANEISMICDKADINVWELIQLANKHPRVDILQPGCGVGGHCIAVDPYFIISNYPKEAQLIKNARDVNRVKTEWVADKVLKTKDNFISRWGRTPSIAIMGLSFKPDIDDLRESPAKYIAQQILQYSKIDDVLYLVEPNLNGHSSFTLTDHQIAFEKADIVVFLVNHKVFRELRNVSCHAQILDFCGVTNSWAKYVP